MENIDIYKEGFENNELNIFDRRFNRIFDDPLYDPTKMSISTGDDAVLDDIFSYQVYNLIKNHWRAAGAPANIQSGMIWNDSDDERLYLKTAAGTNQIAQGAIMPVTDGVRLTEPGAADYMDLLLDGTDAFIKWSDGVLKLITDEGTDTNTSVYIQGKGTGYGILRIYDQDDAEYLIIDCQLGQGYIRTDGSSPAELNFQHDVAQDIRCWDAIASGNPWFYIYGYHAAVGVKYGRFTVASTGRFWVDAEDAGIISQGGTVLAYWNSSMLEMQDEKLATFGTDSDYSIVYHNATDELQIIDGTTPNANVRLKINAAGVTTISNLVISALDTLAFGDTASELTINAGAITVTASHHLVDTEGDAATDNLDTINGGVDGQMLIIHPAAAGRTVVIRDSGVSGGNISTAGGAAVSLTTIYGTAILIYDTGNTIWACLPAMTG